MTKNTTPGTSYAAPRRSYRAISPPRSRKDALGNLLGYGIGSTSISIKFRRYLRGSVEACFQFHPARRGGSSRFVWEEQKRNFAQANTNFPMPTMLTVFNFLGKGAKRIFSQQMSVYQPLDPPLSAYRVCDTPD